MGKAEGAYGEETLPRHGQVLSVVAIIFIAVTFVLCFVAYSAPFWLVHNTEYFDQGLWGKCFFDPELAGRDGCRWVWQFDWALQKSLPSWWKAAQTMYSIGILVLLFAFFIACSNLFCHVGYGSTVVFVIQASLMMSAFLLFGISTLEFGLMSFVDKDYNASVNSAVMIFGWAFYVSICGVIMSLATSITYIVARMTVVQARRTDELKRMRYEYSVVSEAVSMR